MVFRMFKRRRFGTILEFIHLQFDKPFFCSLELSTWCFHLMVGRNRNSIAFSRFKRF